MNVIEVQNLTKDYGSGRGVFDVSFGVGKGEVFGFLGPNGAGKSTTIRHLMGFSSPDSGQTLIFGKPTFEHYHEILNRVGYIPGEIALPAGLTGWEFIRMMQDLQKIHNAERLSQMLEMFELSDAVLKGDTKRMSLGVKRKLAVVTAFMGNPEVLILDEPTSGLDPVMQNKFIEFIHEEKRLGKTILLSSHIFSEIDSTCDRIAIIKDGKIVSEFIADDLKHASKKFYQIDFGTVKDKNSFVKGAHTIPSLEVLKDDKLNLFVSVNDEDINATIAMLSDYIVTAKVLVEDVLRRPLADFDRIPEPILQAMLIVTATLYEERQVSKDKSGVSVTDTLDMIRRMLFAYRKGAF